MASASNERLLASAANDQPQHATQHTSTNIGRQADEPEALAHQAAQQNVPQQAISSWLEGTRPASAQQQQLASSVDDSGWQVDSPSGSSAANQGNEASTADEVGWQLDSPSGSPTAQGVSAPALQPSVSPVAPAMIPFMATSPTARQQQLSFDAWGKTGSTAAEGWGDDEDDYFS